MQRMCLRYALLFRQSSFSVRNYLREIVSGNVNHISLLEHRLKAVEQLNKYEENTEFHKAVEKKLEECLSDIKSGIKEMEKKIEMVSETKASENSESHGKYDRRKRIVIFGMPHFKNHTNDWQGVHELVEFLEIGEIKIKKIFRINSKRNNDSLAPPINIEFYSMRDKFKLFNNSIRERLKKLGSGHLYEHVRIAPDRSFKERQIYQQLRNEMNERNKDLIFNGIADKMWIIRKMSLEKVQVEYYGD